MQARFVYFDLGNVLVNFDHQIAVQQLSQLAGRPPQLVRQVLFDSDLQNRYETGLVTASEFAAAVNQGLQSGLSEAEILEAISAIFEPNHAILPALQAVKAAGVPLGVLSNTCDAHWLWIAAKQWPMLGPTWFDTHVLSYEVRSMKPAAAIYEECERRAGCRGANIFFTDDRADNIAAAADRGWTTHHFHAADGLLSSLQTWLASSPGPRLA